MSIPDNVVPAPRLVWIFSDHETRYRSIPGTRIRAYPSREPMMRKWRLRRAIRHTQQGRGNSRARHEQP